jgi:dUTP pyrophosphatase
MNYNEVGNPKIDILLAPGAKPPKRAHPTDAGADLFALFTEPGMENPRIELEPGNQILVDTGVSVKIPPNYAGFLHARSSQRNKGITCWGTGIIDSDYRGSLKVVLSNQSNKTYTITPDMAIAQLVIQRVQLVDFVDCWNDTDRGNGGFGSTNK